MTLLKRKEKKWFFCNFFQINLNLTWSAKVVFCVQKFHTKPWHMLRTRLGQNAPTITDSQEPAGFWILFAFHFQNCFCFCSRVIKNHSAKLWPHEPFLQCKKSTFWSRKTKSVITFSWQGPLRSSLHHWTQFWVLH